MNMNMSEYVIFGSKSSMEESDLEDWVWGLMDGHQRGWREFREIAYIYHLITFEWWSFLILNLNAISTSLQWKFYPQL